jgi:hypothetical protein
MMVEASAAIHAPIGLQRALRIAAVVLPAAAAWTAFARSAQAHALDLLLGVGACGNVAMADAPPVLLGHCFDCWTAGATAGLVVLLAVAGIERFASTPELRAAGSR